MTDLPDAPQAPLARSSRDPALAIASGALLALLVLSGWAPYDRPTWLLEVAPVLIAWPILFATRKRFPLTALVYAAIFLHACVLIVGGAYTYARVPLGFALADLFELARNPYDRIGHFFQGCVPALVAREILIRGAFVNGRRMRDFLVVCVVLAISASYELIEWGVALAIGASATEFLGTQGDPWDTQWDMFMALVGATTALGLFARLHDRQIASIQPESAR
ncbi:MAG: DUF2238 domain-containing protein [Deltaproteobacteria bacterium]|nr:DUF2238 domain-containing protein [Deltaproteobacteria bacterium]